MTIFGNIYKIIIGILGSVAGLLFFMNKHKSEKIEEQKEVIAEKTEQVEETKKAAKKQVEVAEQEVKIVEKAKKTEDKTIDRITNTPDDQDYEIKL